VADGIETREQADLLVAKGYLLGRGFFVLATGSGGRNAATAANRGQKSGNVLMLDETLARLRKPASMREGEAGRRPTVISMRAILVSHRSAAQTTSQSPKPRNGPH